ncbi:hypothetical protein SAMN04487934_107123 [Eubacterium ruminantium]|nr:hypothetical protein SAMN04487934_107123 [Eubacterium ruminantium]
MQKCPRRKQRKTNESKPMLERFLEETKYVNYNHPNVKALAESLKAEFPDEYIFCFNTE